MTRVSWTLVSALLLASSAAGAATLCTVTTTAVAFGAYRSLSGLARESSGSVDVNCTAQIGSAVSYTITLTAGTGTYASRQLASGANRLGYNLFKDSAYSLVWGDGTGGSSSVSDSYTLAAPPTLRSYTVYGRIPGGQNLTRVGAYSDSVTVTVSY